MREISIFTSRKAAQIAIRKQIEEELRAEIGTELATLASVFGISTDEELLNDAQAMEIPAIASCVELISSTVALPKLKLYKRADGKAVEIDDYRTKLFNVDTKDTLDSTQFKKAMIKDYLLNGNAYAYINKRLNSIESINYVDSQRVSIVDLTADPIFKSFSINVNATEYRTFEFLKLLRSTKDGVRGNGIVSNNQTLLKVAYNTLLYENVLVKTGGNKKGFLKTERQLTEASLANLKEQWVQLYANNSNNMMVLNKGLDFTEASSTSVEMQLVENKKANTIEFCRLFNVPPAILEGNASKEEYKNFIKICILPILNDLETALNRDVLLESEKDSFYFAFDVDEINKADIETRFKAHTLAVAAGIKQIDEVREEENLEPLGLDFVKLNLADSLFFPDTRKIYTANTNAYVDLDNPEGGEKNEIGNKEQ